MDGVIAHARRPVGLEIGRGGVRDPQAAERDMVYGMGLGSPELDHALIERGSTTAVFRSTPAAGM